MGYNAAKSILMFIRCSTVPILFLAASLAVAETTDESADSADDDESKRCINSRLVRSTDVVNDGNILFYMRGGQIYLNKLPAACPGLARDRRFSYVSYSRSLCRLDRINVLREAGFGTYEGRSCKLGRFWPVTQEDIAYLFDQQRLVPEAPVEEPEVEEVGGEPDGDEATR